MTAFRSWALCWAFAYWAVEVLPEFLATLKWLVHTTIGGACVLGLMAFSLLLILLDEPETPRQELTK